MALIVVNQWDVSAGNVDIQKSIIPAAGNWLVVLVAGRTISTAIEPTINVTDQARNVWHLLATRTVRANQVYESPSGPLMVQAWACPGVEFPGWDALRVYAAIQSVPANDAASIQVKILEITGMGNNFLTVDSLVVTTSAVTTGVTVTVPAPSGGADCLQLAVAACDLNYSSYTTTGTGWTQLANSVNTNPNTGMAAAWREATTGGGVTFGFGTSQNWLAMAVSIRQAGIIPVLPNPNWPRLDAQIGFDATQTTPPAEVWWTTIPDGVLSGDTKRGIEYDLGTAQAEPTDLILRDDDGSLSPQDVTGAATATGGGTVTTLVCSDADAGTLPVGALVRITGAASNVNPGFESGTTGWTATGAGSFTTVTSPVVDGGHAGCVIPDGTSSLTQLKPSTHVPVIALANYAFSAWVRCAVTRSIDVRVIWYDSSNVFLANNVITKTVPANTWVDYGGMFTAPSGAASVDIAPTMTGTPPSSNILYLDDLITKPVDDPTVFKVTGKTSASGTTTVTFAAADGSATTALRTTQTGDVLTQVTVDLYTPYQVTAVWNGKMHYWTRGWAERWPETWTSDDPAGMLTLTGTGALANLTPNDPTCLAGEIMRRKPWAYWPLNDPAGSLNASNVSGRSVVQLIQTSSKAGTGAAGVAEFAASTQGVTDSGDPTAVSLLGDSGNCWYVHSLTSAEINSGQGYALVSTGSGFPAIGGGVSIVMVFRSDGDSVIFNSTINPTLLAIKNLDPGTGASLGNIIKVSRQHNGTNEGYLIVTTWDQSTHSSASTTSTQNVTGTSEFQVLALTFTATSWQLYAGNSGNGGAVQVGSGTCNLTDTWTTIEIAGEADQFTNGLCYEGGRFAHVAVFDRVLTSGEILSIGSAMDAHQGDEFTDNRVQRKTDTVALVSPRCMSANGQKTLSSDVGGQSTVADTVTSIGTYEDALVFEDAAASLQYRPPALANGQSPVATLGERTDLGEIPYQPGVVVDFDATYLINYVTVTNSVVNQGAFTDNIATQTFTAIDAASQGRYGVRTLPQDRTTQLYNAQDAWALAYWLLSQYATRKRRIETVEIDPASNPALWHFVLTVEVGDLVTVMRRQVGAPVVSMGCVILQVAHAFDMTAPSWRTTLTLAPSRPTTLVLNDPVLGIVGDNVIGLE